MLDSKRRSDDLDQLQRVPAGGLDMDPTDREAATRQSDLQFKDPPVIQNRARDEETSSKPSKADEENFCGNPDLDCGKDHENAPTFNAMVTDVKRDGFTWEVMLKAYDPNTRFSIYGQHAYLMDSRGHRDSGGVGRIFPKGKDKDHGKTAKVFFILGPGEKVNVGDNVMIGKGGLLKPSKVQMTLPATATQRYKEGTPQVVGMIQGSQGVELQIKGGMRDGITVNRAFIMYTDATGAKQVVFATPFDFNDEYTIVRVSGTGGLTGLARAKEIGDTYKQGLLEAQLE
jgi:hypothetical protein